MHLMTALTQAHASLQERRDLPTALHAFTVLENASRALELAEPQEFVVWAYATQAAYEGRTCLESVVIGHEPAQEFGSDAVDANEAAQRMAALGSLVRDILIEQADNETNPDSLLTLLTAARNGSEVQLFLDGNQP